MSETATAVPFLVGAAGTAQASIPWLQETHLHDKPHAHDSRRWAEAVAGL